MPNTALKEAISQIRDQISAAESLKAQKSALLNDAEKAAIGHTIASTRRVVSSLEESAGVPDRSRVDGGMNTWLSNGPLSGSHTSRADEAWMQLTIASQSLAAVVAVLSNRQQAPMAAELSGEVQEAVGVQRRPPTYDENEYLKVARLKSWDSMLRPLPPRSPTTASMPGNTAISELPGDIPYDRTQVLPVELPAGYIPYRHGRTNKSSTSIPAVPESDTLPEVVRSEVRLSGRARSRKWLQSHAESAEPVTSGCVATELPSNNQPTKAKSMLY